MSTPYFTDKWFTSLHNYADEVRAQLKFAKQIQFHDVTLRDGEQQAGVVFTKDDKIRIAEKLAEVGVHRIEAGMATVSKADEEAIKEIVRRKLGPKIFAFSRCMKSDIQRAVDCGVEGVVVEIPSSEHIIELGYEWPMQKAIDLSVEATRFAKEQGLYVVFFTIDATRADPAWFLNLIEHVATHGHMDALVLVDTFGGASPHAITHFTRMVQAKIQKPLEAHFHDDFGMAVANTIMALSLGVEVAHVTVSSLGERAGNCALEDLALALLTLYGIDTGLRYDKLYDLSKLVRQLANFPLPPNRPIVGDMLYKVESGIIATWLARLKEKRPVELFPFHWALVGQEPAEIVLGKGSGRDSMLYYLAALGFRVDPSDPRVDRLLVQVKELSLAKKSLLSVEEFRVLANAAFAAA
ncbi:MAG: pyruvate carboxyltransferase [Armatimonadota bacterium]|nr:pyruvate carboxyltransferase [Armatimonadota bacterium]MDR7544503.1 pyruvate carboxyltransferase [Armatimonadota bacterium]